MILTPDQIAEVLSILDRYALIFVAHNVGPSALTRQERGTLVKLGIDPTKILENSSKVTQAFKFGMLTDALGDPATKAMSYPQFRKYLKEGRMIKLNDVEKSALENLKFQTKNDVTGLVEKIKTDVGNMHVKHSKVVTDAAKSAIERRKGVQSIISDIGHQTGKWNRDLGRIGDYVLHTAFDEGRASMYQRKGGDNALVYKDVYPGACKHCQRLLLTSGIGSAPKVFTLGELRENGTNVGRKALEWKAVIGPIHPWCRCTLMDTPLGFNLKDYREGKWMWNGKDFVMVQEKWKPKVKRKSKITVTVNGKQTVI